MAIFRGVVQEVHKQGYIIHADSVADAHRKLGAYIALGNFEESKDVCIDEGDFSYSHRLPLCEDCSYELIKE